MVSCWINIHFLSALTGAEKWHVVAECFTSLKGSRVLVSALCKLPLCLWLLLNSCPFCSSLQSRWWWKSNAPRRDPTGPGPSERSALWACIPLAHYTCWRMWMKEKRKRRGWRRTANREASFLSLWFFGGRVVFSLSNFTKDHRLLAASNIKQFALQTPRLHHWYSRLRHTNTSELLWRLTEDWRFVVKLTISA